MKTGRKKLLSRVLVLALVMALGTASAQEAEMTAQGVTVVRNHVEETVGHQQIVVDYPTFSCEDPQLELYRRGQRHGRRGERNRDRGRRKDHQR